MKPSLSNLKKLFSDDPEMLRLLDMREQASFIEEIESKKKDLENLLESASLLKDGYTPVKGVDYFDGEDYVLTDEDKQDIASNIEVPIVEKVIEKTHTVREVPIVTEIVREKAVTDNPEVTAEKLNTLKEAIDSSVIKGLITKEYIDKRYEAKVGDNFNIFKKRIDTLDQRWHGSGVTNSNGLFVNNATNSTLIRSGTGPYTLALNLSNANTWTADVTVANGFIIKGQYSNLAGSAYINPDGSAVFGGGATVITNTGNITALSFIKTGGTSSQFLKADGSVDSTAYAPVSSLAGYVPYTGATTNVDLGTHSLTLNTLNDFSGQITGTGNQTSGGTTTYQNFETGLGYAAAFPTSQVSGMAGFRSATFGSSPTVWTVEAWCTLRGNYSGGNAPTIFSFQGNVVQLRFQSLVPQAFWFGTPNASINSSASVTLGVPFHLAFDSDGAGNMVMWLNGVNVGSTSTFPNYAITTNNYIGNVPNGAQMFPGLISEVRVSNIRRYTSGFTPSTTAWATDANTLFLGQFKDANPTQFTDYSGLGNNFTLIGTPVPTYDVGNINYLAFRNAINRGSNALTIGQYGDASVTFKTTNFFSSVTNNNAETAWTFNTPVNLTYPDNRLVSFQNNSVEKFGLFFDGSLSKLPLPIKQAAGASNDFINLNTSSSEIKWKVDSFYNTTIGSTKMTTSGDRTVGGLFQLNNFEGSGGFAQGFSVLPTNAAYIKFPTYGTFATTSYTLEAWVYIRSFPTGSNCNHVCNSTNTTANQNIRVVAGGGIFYQTSSSGVSLGTGVLNTWQHVAVTWDGTTTRGFVNGVLGGTSSLYFGQPDAQYIGNCISYLTADDIIIQEYRCSDIARYTTNFTPPTGPFTTDANTKLLAHLNGNANDSSGGGHNGTVTGTLATDYAWVTGQVAVTNSTRNAITRQFEVSTGKNYVQIGESGDSETRLAGGDFLIQGVGKTVGVKKGTNAKIGTATLVAGTVTISTTAVNAAGTSMIILSAPRGTLINIGELEESARTAGTSFTITSTNILDTCTFDWWIVEIIP